MTVTVIRKDGSVEHITTLELTDDLNQKIASINNNPLIAGHYTVDKEYTDKSVREIAEFLHLKSHV